MICVQNIWLKIHGEKKKEDRFKGHFTMSENWFDDYVYMVVVDKKVVNKKVLDCLKTKPIVLPYWSPFGNLLQS